jgi:hypothetical protein
MSSRLAGLVDVRSSSQTPGHPAHPDAARGHPMNACGFAAVLLISALTLSGPTEGLSMSAFADEAF